MSKRKPQPEYTEISKNQDIKEMVRRGVLPLSSGITIAPNAFSETPGYIVDTVFHESLPRAQLIDHDLEERVVQSRRMYTEQQRASREDGRTYFIVPSSGSSGSLPNASNMENALRNQHTLRDLLSSDLASAKYYPEGESNYVFK